MGKLIKKLKEKDAEAAIESHPKYKALAKQNAALLSKQERGVEADARVLKLEAEVRELKAKNKHLHTAVETGNERLRTFQECRAAGSKKIPKAKREPGGNATAVLVLSDWHVEETVRPETVNGLNEFNLQIAAERIERTFQKAVMLLEDARQLADIRTLVVAALGDFISGYIHEELEESNALAPLPACRFARQHLAAGLDFLLKEADLERIQVVTAIGNHGRTGARMRAATGADNSYEQNLYHEMAQSYRERGEERIEWQIGDSYHNWLDIQGHACRFHHGDAIRYSGGVGDINIPVNKAIAQWNKARTAAIDFFGHWHSWKEEWHWVANGSLIGFGAYSLRIKASFQRPVQTFAVIDRDYGMTRALKVFCN